MKVGPNKYNRAVFLKERALEMVRRYGIIVHISNRGVARECRSSAFTVFYADPETAECDEYYHLDVHADGRGKVFSVVWLGNGMPEVVTFRRGSWEEYFVS